MITVFSAFGSGSKYHLSDDGQKTRCGRPTKGLFYEPHPPMNVEWCSRCGATPEQVKQAQDDAKDHRDQIDLENKTAQDEAREHNRHIREQAGLLLELVDDTEQVKDLEVLETFWNKSGYHNCLDKKIVIEAEGETFMVEVRVHYTPKGVSIKPY